MVSLHLNDDDDDDNENDKKMGALKYSQPKHEVNIFLKTTEYFTSQLEKRNARCIELCYDCLRMIFVVPFLVGMRTFHAPHTEKKVEKWTVSYNQWLHQQLVIKVKSYWNIYKKWY